MRAEKQHARLAELERAAYDRLRNQARKSKAQKTRITTALDLEREYKEKRRQQARTEIELLELEHFLTTVR